MPNVPTKDPLAAFFQTLGKFESVEFRGSKYRPTDVVVRIKSSPDIYQNLSVTERHVRNPGHLCDDLKQALEGMRAQATESEKGES